MTADFMINDPCTMFFTHEYESPLGMITMASDGESLTGLWFVGQKYYADTLTEDSRVGDLPVFEEADRWLDAYFSGRNPGATPAVRFVSGSQFRREVWQMLTQIPYGVTITYKDIAAEIARRHGLKSMSAQAVGGAVGHNPVSIIVPCHRVLGSSGALTGYAGGIDRKSRLLEIERALS